MELHLESVIPPSVNHYLGYRVVTSKNKRPIAVSYVKPEAAKYKKQFTKYVEEQTKKQHWDIEPNKYQHFYVDAVFYFDKINRDCNNYFKVMLDAITDTKLIWLDDNVVCERVRRIYYDPTNPRVELTIKPVEYIGVFDNISQLDKFKTNCLECTRYTRNCSILKNALIGKVQENISDGVCLKFKAKKK